MSLGALVAEVDDAALQRDMGEAVTAVLSRHECSLTTKWVVLAETIDDQGVRGLWPLASDGTKAWDVKGMLREALDMESAKTFADYLRDS